MQLFTLLKQLYDNEHDLTAKLKEALIQIEKIVEPDPLRAAWLKVIELELRLWSNPEELAKRTLNGTLKSKLRTLLCATALIDQQLPATDQAAADYRQFCANLLNSLGYQLGKRASGQTAPAVLHQAWLAALLSEKEASLIAAEIKTSVILELTSITPRLDNFLNHIDLIQNTFGYRSVSWCAKFKAAVDDKTKATLLVALNRLLDSHPAQHEQMKQLLAQELCEGNIYNLSKCLYLPDNTELRKKENLPHFVQMLTILLPYYMESFYSMLKSTEDKECMRATLLQQLHTTLEAEPARQVDNVNSLRHEDIFNRYMMFYPQDNSVDIQRAFENDLATLIRQQRYATAIYLFAVFASYIFNNHKIRFHTHPICYRMVLNIKDALPASASDAVVTPIVVMLAKVTAPNDYFQVAQPTTEAVRRENATWQTACIWLLQALQIIADNSPALATSFKPAMDRLITMRRDLAFMHFFDSKNPTRTGKELDVIADMVGAPGRENLLLHDRYRSYLTPFDHQILAYLDQEKYNLITEHFKQQLGKKRLYYVIQFLNYCHECIKRSTVYDGYFAKIGDRADKEQKKSILLQKFLIDLYLPILDLLLTQLFSHPDMQAQLFPNIVPANSESVDNLFEQLTTTPMLNTHGQQIMLLLTMLNKIGETLQDEQSSKKTSFIKRKLARALLHNAADSNTPAEVSQRYLDHALCLIQPNEYTSDKNEYMKKIFSRPEWQAKRRACLSSQFQAKLTTPVPETLVNHVTHEIFAGSYYLPTITPAEFFADFMRDTQHIVTPNNPETSMPTCTALVALQTKYHYVFFCYQRMQTLSFELKYDDMEKVHERMQAIKDFVKHQKSQQPQANNSKNIMLCLYLNLVVLKDDVAAIANLCSYVQQADWQPEELKTLYTILNNKWFEELIYSDVEYFKQLLWATKPSASDINLVKTVAAELQQTCEQLYRQHQADKSPVVKWDFILHNAQDRATVSTNWPIMTYLDYVCSGRVNFGFTEEQISDLQDLRNQLANWAKPAQQAAPAETGLLAGLFKPAPKGPAHQPKPAAKEEGVELKDLKPPAPPK